MRFDGIGYWSELKLEILEKYAKAYSTILAARTNPAFHHVYVDAFSGSGMHVSKTTGQLVEGSPLKALAVEPPFREYFFIDLDGDKVEALRAAVGERREAWIDVMRHAIALNAAYFNTHRMVQEYVAHAYV